MPSELHDEDTFYHAFINDLNACREEVIIESPFISSSRMKKLYPVFERLIKRGVRVYVMTRDPREHDESMKEQSEYEIQRFERLGVQVLLCTGNHHRKLAILDRKILWEGSLNILSQSVSREIMRKIADQQYAMAMFDFLHWNRFI
ncbi:MAG TPA: phospholipase D-like domain-containing protein [Patescibacteria group bacterium]|nr:phospholipase D-like domain-containing protein [Patescibacteria group bacterium]